MPLLQLQLLAEAAKLQTQQTLEALPKHKQVHAQEPIQLSRKGLSGLARIIPDTSAIDI